MKPTPKRICIDIRALETSHKDRGIGYYVFNLVFNLIELDKNNKYALLCHQPRQNPLYGEFHNSPNVTFIAGPIEGRKFSRYLLQNYLFLTRFLFQQKFDIFFSPDYTTPLWWPKKTRTALLFYDFIPILFPSFEHLTRGRKIEAYLRKKTLPKIDQFFTISETSKSDGIRLFNLDPQKIKVIYGAADERFKPVDQDTIMTFRNRYTGGAPYLLYVGEITDPRKNVTFLVESFAEIQQDQKLKPYKLLLAGRCRKDNETYAQIMTLISKHNLKDKVVFTGFIPENEIHGLFASATLTLFPSTYEGFGLPILQSLASNVPAIGFANSSVQELFNNATPLVADFDKISYVETIKQLLIQKDIYAKYQTNGLKIAHQFSWEKTAKLCLESLEK